VLIDLLGNDVQHGGSGADITIGGTEQFIATSSNIIFGDSTEDINIWRAAMAAMPFSKRPVNTMG
jgi:hypothetical protein